MGADAEVYVFDHRRYRDEVVPALRDLLRAADSWAVGLAEAVVEDPDLPSYARRHPVDLARHCTYLGEDLRLLAPERTFRLCPSRGCPERDRCPLHETRGLDLVEEFNVLFEAAVCLRCLGPSQFVGRSMDPRDYTPLLDRLDVPADAEVRVLLADLGLRGALVGAMFSNGDGVHGWLTPQEAVDLAEHLGRLPLPRYEPAFEAMTSFKRRSGGTSYPAESFLELSLSFVRTVATIAARDGQGILWGNDLMTAHWRELARRATP